MTHPPFSRDNLLKKLGEREEGFMLAELYGFFLSGVVELLDEIKKLREEGRVVMINNNRVRLP